MEPLKVAVLGATGMVGQQYVRLLAQHPFFKLTCITGRESVGRRYKEAAPWMTHEPLPDYIGALEVQPTEPSAVDADLVFSPLPTEAAAQAEPLFAQAGFPVVSDASAHRMQPDVPLLIPEVNAEHSRLIAVQQRRRRWKGFIATTPNCTATGLALVLKPLHDAFKLRRIVVTTLQAISGAGFPGVPSLAILDNVIPFIEGEEEKVAQETRKILGRLSGKRIVEADVSFALTCTRVPTLDGHFETVYLEAEKELDPVRAKELLRSFVGPPQKLHLLSAPRQPIIVRDEPDRPQTRLDRLAGSVPGMSAVVGRIRQGPDAHTLQLALLTHNTIRGGAGCAILTAELLVSQGFIAASR